MVVLKGLFGGRAAAADGGPVVPPITFPSVQRTRLVPTWECFLDFLRNLFVMVGVLAMPCRVGELDSLRGLRWERLPEATNRSSG